MKSISGKLKFVGAVLFTFTMAFQVPAYAVTGTTCVLNATPRILSALASRTTSSTLSILRQAARISTPSPALISRNYRPTPITNPIPLCKLSFNRPPLQRAFGTTSFAQSTSPEQSKTNNLKGSLAEYLVSLVEGNCINGYSESSEQDPQDFRKARAEEIDREIQRIFGRSLRREEWPYDFEKSGLNTKIAGMSAEDGRVRMVLNVYNSKNELITKKFERTWSLENGRPSIYNAHLSINTDTKPEDVKLGELVNQGQQKLLKSLPQGGTITVRTMDVGSYTWANQGFKFMHSSQLNHFRQEAKKYFSGFGINMSEEDLAHLTLPVHFSAFTDGKKRDSSPFSVSDYATTDYPEESTAFEPRACDLGKLFMLHRSWTGIWDSRDDNEATKFQEAYRGKSEAREKALKVLSPEYRALLEKAQKR
jgi:hypothetical protein